MKYLPILMTVPHTNIRGQHGMQKTKSDKGQHSPSLMHLLEAFFRHQPPMPPAVPSCLLLTYMDIYDDVM
jgi:hypothetical protein